MLRNIASKLLVSGLAFTLATFTAPAMAQSAGTWSLAAGAGWVVPKIHNGNLPGLGGAAVHEGNDIKPTLTLEYFVLDNVGIQVLAAVPFTQDVYLNGIREGNVQHLPPAVYLQYHLTGLLARVSPSLKRISPFVGAGIEHSFIYNSHLDGALAPHELAVSGSTGYTFHTGVDYALSPDHAIRLDLYYIKINSNVRLDGVFVGTTRIDPFVYDLAYVWHF